MKRRKSRTRREIGNPDIIARRKGKKINGEAKVKGHQRCTVKWVKYSCFCFSLPKKSFISIMITEFSEGCFWTKNKPVKSLKLYLVKSSPKARRNLRLLLEFHM